MISLLKTIGWISLIALVIPIFFPVVTELPFGLDEAFVIFVSTIKGLISLLPWLEIVWNIMLLALGVKVLLFTWHWIHTIINLVRS